MTDRIHLEGNNGGDFITLHVINDGQKSGNGLVRLEVGHCCTKIMRHVVPIEFITLALTNAINAAGSVEAVIENSSWDVEFKERMLKSIKNKGF